VRGVPSRSCCPAPPRRLSGRRRAPALTSTGIDGMRNNGGTNALPARSPPVGTEAGERRWWREDRTNTADAAHELDHAGTTSSLHVTVPPSLGANRHLQSKPFSYGY
jgi:hypothetical protein